MGIDIPLVEVEEKGWPTWEERFLHVDVVVRAKLNSSRPWMVAFSDGEGRDKYYPVIERNFRVMEVFRGTVPLDFVVVWQVGWEYYESKHAHCVELDTIVELRENYEYLDHEEAILFLTRTRNLDWLEDISRWIGNYFIARLPNEMEPPNSLDSEELRWLPLYEGDSFYDRKYPKDSPQSEPGITVTRQELREVGRKIEALRSTHDLKCVNDAYRQARNSEGDIEGLMENCLRKR